MGFSCGIVGLPNVGKSTLFNALCSTAQAAAENYPFCTIEPNVARVPVPDARLARLAAVTKRILFPVPPGPGPGVGRSPVNLRGLSSGMVLSRRH